MSESDTMFNEQDRRCAVVQVMLSPDPSYDNRTIARTIAGLPRITGTCPGWWKQSFRLRLWSLVWFQTRVTSCHLTKPTPTPTWTRWTTSFGHTSRTSSTWPPITPIPARSPSSAEYSLSSRRAPADACGKGILPVSDPYRGGDWGWRRLHWIDVRSTT